MTHLDLRETISTALAKPAIFLLYLKNYSAFGQDGDFSERGNGGRYHDFLQPLDGADAMKLLNSVWLQC